jgi:hypothetical protein
MLPSRHSSNCGIKKRIARFPVGSYFLYLISEAQDEKFQAIFLYKFIENINWPDARKNLVVGIVGQTYVQDELEKILQSRNNSTISVKKITSAEEATCDITLLPKKQNAMFNRTTAGKVY